MLSLKIESMAISPHTILLVKVTDELDSLNIPPPFVAWFLVKVQLVTVADEFALCIPPPSLVEFSEKMQLITVGDEVKLDIPPPRLSALFPEKMQLVTIGEE